VCPDLQLEAGSLQPFPAWQIFLKKNKFRIGVSSPTVVITPNPLIMTTKLTNLLTYTVILGATLVFSACDYSEDPGPLQEIEKEFNETDFDRLEIGDALHIDVEQGNFFEVSVRGDRRNVNDLEVFKEGSTLIVRFDEWENRRHETYVTITMPTIVGANFSGASNSRVSGFNELTKFDLYLSGASVSQLDVVASEFKTIVSGASVLNLRGSASVMEAEITGASVLKGFNFPVVTADVLASGASHGSLTVADVLRATATGASSITYRGNPSVTSDVSGSSAVNKE
jgi:hypothetical protein